MAGSSFGTVFTVTTFGESHGPALGCVVDGCPSGLALEAEDIRRELRRRRPGSGPASTTRAETDEPEILSGIFEGKTLGTPIAVMVRNVSQRSADYEALKDVYRPGHADRAWEEKYGFRDYRGGGRSSGRETLGRVAAGAIAKVFLASQGITIRAWTSAAAGIEVPGPEEPGFDLDEAERNPLRVPRRDYAERIGAALEAIRREGDSAGGIVSCVIQGLPPGLGEPVFGKLNALLAGAVLSIGAVRAVEFGGGGAAGFAAAGSRGSEQNSRAGGISGGISTGLPVEFRAAFKPVPSIAKPQKALNRDGGIQDLVIAGRHDTCIVPRAVPVVEAMAALVLADLLLLRRLDRA